MYIHNRISSRLIIKPYKGSCPGLKLSRRLADYPHRVSVEVKDAWFVVWESTGILLTFHLLSCHLWRFFRKENFIRNLIPIVFPFSSTPQRSLQIIQPRKESYRESLFCCIARRPCSCVKCAVFIKQDESCVVQIEIEMLTMELSLQKQNATRAMNDDNLHSIFISFSFHLH
jgi:hypothetical protein